MGYAKIHRKMQETVSSGRLSENAQERIQVRSDCLEELAKMILHVPELKMEMAKLVNVLIQKAKKQQESMTNSVGSQSNQKQAM